MAAHRSTLAALCVAALLSVLGLAALLRERSNQGGHAAERSSAPPPKAAPDPAASSTRRSAAVGAPSQGRGGGGALSGTAGEPGQLQLRQSPRPRLILGVASAPWAIDHRKAMRATVGQCLRTAAHLGPTEIKLVFFTDATSHVEAAVKEEQRLHHDVLVTPTQALGQHRQKDVRLVEFLRQARALDGGRGADFYGKMDDDVFICPHNIATLLPALSPNSYLGTASARGKKTHDQQFVIFGEDVVSAVLELHDAKVVNRTTPQEESKYLHKLIGVHADARMVIDYRTYAPTGSAITHVRDNKAGKPCMRSFEECPFKFESGPGFCSGGNLSFHRFRDKFREIPGKALRKYFSGVCDAGEAAWENPPVVGGAA